MVFEEISEERDPFGINAAEIGGSFLGGLVGGAGVVFIEVELDDGIGAAGKHQ
jgi:hypothetical protein